MDSQDFLLAVRDDMSTKEANFIIKVSQTHLTNQCVQLKGFHIHEIHRGKIYTIIFFIIYNL